MKGGWEEERALSTGPPDMADFRMIFRDGEKKRKSCVELGYYDAQRTE